MEWIDPAAANVIPPSLLYPFVSLVPEYMAVGSTVHPPIVPDFLSSVWIYTISASINLPPSSSVLDHKFKLLLPETICTVSKYVLLVLSAPPTSCLLNLVLSGFPLTEAWIPW